MKRAYKWLIAGGVVVTLAAVWLSYRYAARQLTQDDFEYAKVEIGDVSCEVSATGKIQPVNTVTVGTQVSGIVEKVLVDYNAEVKAGELLAKLDTALLYETMHEAEARLSLARAKAKKAQLDFNRVTSLYKRKLVATDEYETSKINLESADAEVAIADADYKKAARNYDYATITSPVSGTVIARKIEAGQTVAASFQAPVLFEIAEDLSKMQIETSIAEADIGLIKSGMKTTFTVDAYPKEEFYGQVGQIRLSPTEESNVVMYTVIIEVDNRSRQLLPGMTASVKIKIASAHDVPRLSMQALQYRPSAAIKQKVHIQTVQEKLRDDEEVVYSFQNKQLIPKIITKGLANDEYVEIKDGLKVGDEVILEAKKLLKK